MKAWKVTVPYTSIWAYVLADTRGQAKRRAVQLDESDSLSRDWTWIDLRCVRYPEMDGERITYRALFEMGRMWTECAGCGTRIDGADLDDDFRAHPPIWLNDWQVVCGPECYRRWLDRAERIRRPPIFDARGTVLYADW